MKNIRWIYKTFVVLCAMVFSLHAQILQGVVTDAIIKKPIIGATITLPQISKISTSDTAGHYRVDSIPAGNYLVKIEVPGYLKYTKKIIITGKGVGGLVQNLDAALYKLSTNAESSSGTMLVQYQFPNHADVQIIIQDNKGRTVREAFDRSRAGGMRIFSWDGNDNFGKPLPPGRYSCKVVSGRLVMMRTLEIADPNAPLIK